MEKGIWISERIVRLIEAGGSTEAGFDIINIDISTALASAKKIKDEDTRLRFLGRRFIDLVKDLRKFGFLDETQQ